MAADLVLVDFATGDEHGGRRVRVETFPYAPLVRVTVGNRRRNDTSGVLDVGQVAELHAALGSWLRDVAQDEEP